MSVEAGLNPDFVDLLEAFAKAKVEFIVVDLLERQPPGAA